VVFASQSSSMVVREKALRLIMEWAEAFEVRISCGIDMPWISNTPVDRSPALGLLGHFFETEE
jgi:hypothetical protein